MVFVSSLANPTHHKEYVFCSTIFLVVCPHNKVASAQFDGMIWDLVWTTEWSILWEEIPGTHVVVILCTQHIEITRTNPLKLGGNSILSFFPYSSKTKVWLVYSQQHIRSLISPFLISLHFLCCAQDIFPLACAVVVVHCMHYMFHN